MQFRLPKEEKEEAEEEEDADRWEWLE